jgi:hypothetical protein
MSGYQERAANSNVLSYDRFQRNSAKITSYCRNNKPKSADRDQEPGLW